MSIDIRDFFFEILYFVWISFIWIILNKPELYWDLSLSLYLFIFLHEHARTRACVCVCVCMWVKMKSYLYLLKFLSMHYNKSRVVSPLFIMPVVPHSWLCVSKCSFCQSQLIRNCLINTENPKTYAKIMVCKYFNGIFKRCIFNKSFSTIQVQNLLFRTKKKKMKCSELVIFSDLLVTHNYSHEYKIRIFLFTDDLL